MLKKYQVKFRQHYNSSGETDDFPTDFFHIGGIFDIIDDCVFIDYQNLPSYVDKEGFCVALWYYEIQNKYHDYFERCLDCCPTVLSWRYN